MTFSRKHDIIKYNNNENRKRIEGRIESFDEKF